MIPQSVKFMLGLCQRAGKVASGDLAVEQALKKRKADLMIMAEDASERTQEKFLGLAARAGVRCYCVGTREELGEALGKSHRAVAVIQSRDFTKGIVGALSNEGLTPATGRG